METDRNFLLLDRFRQVARLMRMGWTPDDIPTVKEKMIRTSGEQRLSNWMLWQLAYAEFYFPEVLWPDFNKKELEKAIEYYNSRDRRFGGL